jgi:hypothetical protein
MDVDEITADLLQFIEENDADLVRTAFTPGQIGFQYLAVLPNPQRTKVLVEKNIKGFGGINQYVEDFVPKVLAGLATMPAGPQKEGTKAGQRVIVEELLTREGLTEENKQRLEGSLQAEFAAVGGRRKKTRRSKKRRSTRKRVRSA